MSPAEKAALNEAFRNRTKAAALRVIRLYQRLPRTGDAEILGKQLLRCATSVAANYRAACRGRSAAEFFAKISICIEEADETQLWLELLGEANIIAEEKLIGLKQEHLEIVSVLATSRKIMSK